MLVKLAIGIDNIKFGMTEGDVISLIGKPDRRIIDSEFETILKWNTLKLSLTFYESENNKLGYIRTNNEGLCFQHKKIIGVHVKEIKEKVFSSIISEWEYDDFETFDNHFNNKYWVSIKTECEVATTFEMGVPFKNKEDYDWPN